MALDTANAVAVLRDLTRTFDRAVVEASVFYPLICTDVDSDGEDEKYGWLGDMPGVREWLGDRIFHELRAAHYTLANKDWEDSLLIPKNKIADSRLGLFDALLAKLGQRAAQHPDKLVFQALVAGESTPCFDGQYFFDTDHAWGDSGTQSNDLTFAAADGTTPTVAEFKAAWRASVTKMLGFVDDRGEPFNQPTVGTNLSNLVCIVPLALRDVAVDAVESTVLSNSTNVVIDKPKIIASPFLTDATKFYTFYVGDVLKPFVFQKREALSRQTKGLEDIETKFVKFMTAARYNVGYLAWWNAVLTTFT